MDGVSSMRQLKPIVRGVSSTHKAHFAGILKTFYSSQRVFGGN